MQMSRRLQTLLLVGLAVASVSAEQKHEAKHEHESKHHPSTTSPTVQSKHELKLDKPVTAPKKHKSSATSPAASLLPPPPPDAAPAPRTDPSSVSAGVSAACLLLLALSVVGLYWRDIGTMSSNLSSWGLQMGSFLALVAVQSTALLLFRVCQTSGAYEFSPASSVALTELCKLALAISLHSRHVRESGKPMFEGLTLRIVANYFGLAMLYTINNQLTFYCFQMVDPGTFGLGKSLAPYLVAVMLRCTGQMLNELQWVCIVLQCVCIAITQYNPCKASGVASVPAYAVLGISVSITAVSSVWNQKVVKGFDVPVNLQNALLYTFGTLIALCSYVGIPDPAHPHGFLHGYSIIAVFLVVFQAFHGLAVTLVYKYADAIVKNFANSAVMSILVVASAIWFGAAASLTAYLGVVGVLVTTYAYMNIALKMPAS